MIKPYTVVALSPVQIPIVEPEDALRNTKRIINFMRTAIAVAAPEGYPVKLVVIPEMAIQGLQLPQHHLSLSPLTSHSSLTLKRLTCNK